MRRGVLDQLVNWAYSLFVLLMLVRCVISWVRSLHYHPLVWWVENVTDPILRPLQRLMPPWRTGGLDFSPAIAILLAYIVAEVLKAILP